jgi:hypothetical protein
MSSALFLQLFSSWELVFACIALMLILPLLFYLASLSPRRKGPSLSAIRKKKPKPRPAQPEKTEEEGDDEIEINLKDKPAGRK